MSHDHAIPDAEYGVVTLIEQDRPTWPQPTGPTRYGIQITVPGECDQCAIKESCYSSDRVVWATSDTQLTEGQTVHVEMGPGTILSATAWVYGIPLLALLLGVLTGYLWLFAWRIEETRVLLSASLGVGLMLVTGVILARLNGWISRKIAITASPARPTEA